MARHRELASRGVSEALLICSRKFALGGRHEIRRRQLLQLVAGAVGVLRFARAYPTRTVTLIVPFAAGGATDVATRIHCQARTEAGTCSFEDRASLSEEATVFVGFEGKEPCQGRAPSLQPMINRHMRPGFAPGPPPEFSAVQAVATRSQPVPHSARSASRSLRRAAQAHRDACAAQSCSSA